MNKKFWILAAIASVALASCSNDEYFGDPGGITGERAISFDYQFQNATRGSEADAQKLNNQFIVWGEKNESGGGAISDGNLVFKNYLVKYTASTANTTTSNTNDWEYVGISATSNENTNISPNSGTDTQTIK